jgi:arylsulfatase A-like enzyme
MEILTSRRARFGALTLGVAATALTAMPGLSAPLSGHRPPNIVFIVADDLGYDQTSLYGRAGAIPTPNIDAIAGDGIRATQGYVASPVCSPSRSAMLTGREPARVGADSNFLARARNERMPTDTYLKHLPPQYTSMAIGKWDLAGAKTFEGHHLPHAMGFDDFYGFLGGEHPYCPPAKGNSNLKAFDQKTGKYVDRASSTYLTNEFTNRAVDYINSHAAGSATKPFNLYLAYNAPHDPLDTPTTCAGGTQSNQDRFAEMVTIMDNGIGQVRRALAANGIAKDTLVVFVSDNGQQHDYFTGGTRGGKYTLFEGGVKVPMAFSWPAVLPAGRTYTQPLSTLDLYATFLAAAASNAPPPGTPGVNLIPHLTGHDDTVPHHRLSWRYVVDDNGSGHQGDTLLAQRSGNLKWVSVTRPPSGDASDANTVNYVFDLAANPGEESSRNLWSNATLRDPLLDVHHAWNSFNPVSESFKNARTNKYDRAHKPDGFVEAGGTWTVVGAGSGDKSYRGTTTNLEGRSMLETSYYSDVNVSASVRLTTSGQAGVIIRASSAGERFDGYVAKIVIPQDGSTCGRSAPNADEKHPQRGGSARVVIAKVVNGKGEPVACQDIALTTGEAYSLAVHAIGEKITVDLGGKERVSWTDNSGKPFVGGRVGFRVETTSSKGTAQALFGRLHAERRG